MASYLSKISNLPLDEIMRRRDRLKRQGEIVARGMDIVGSVFEKFLDKTGEIFSTKPITAGAVAFAGFTLGSMIGGPFVVAGIVIGGLTTTVFGLAAGNILLNHIDEKEQYYSRSYSLRAENGGRAFSAHTNSGADIPASHGPLSDLKPLRAAAGVVMPGDTSAKAVAAAPPSQGASVSSSKARQYSPW